MHDAIGLPVEADEADEPELFRVACDGCAQVGPRAHPEPEALMLAGIHGRAQGFLGPHSAQAYLVPVSTATEGPQ
jgi:hypothetical protein